MALQCFSVGHRIMLLANAAALCDIKYAGRLVSLACANRVLVSSNEKPLRQVNMQYCRDIGASPHHIAVFHTWILIL